MTEEEMIAAIEAGNITRKLVDALVDFEWENDPYGVLNEYGYIEDRGVRAKLRKDARLALETDPQAVIAYLREE